MADNQITLGPEPTKEQMFSLFNEAVEKDPGIAAVCEKLQTHMTEKKKAAMTLSSSVPSHPEYHAVCPACGSKNIHTWEQGWGEKAHGGKDCSDCKALSRRWQGAGNGLGIWIQGPGITPQMTVGEVETLLKTLTTATKETP